MDFDKKLKLHQLSQELAGIEYRRQQLLQEIAGIENGLANYSETCAETTDRICNASSSKDKIKLFRGLFKGREDVYARRFESSKTGKFGYQPVCKNEWSVGICHKPSLKCTGCNYREYLTLTDDVIERHLRGQTPNEPGYKDYVVGIYPMLHDETCWFLAVDFDKSNWQDDISAFLETCNQIAIPVAIERSRSGNGGHAWIFFEESISCSLARMLGSFLITETMRNRPEIGFDSYDRFFPNQDTLPEGGFGNLIALPLQKKARDSYNTIFLDDKLNPYNDQWEFLSSIRKISRHDVQTLIDSVRDKGVMELGLPTEEEGEENKPWELPPSKEVKRQIKGPFPEMIEIVISNQLFISKETLSPSLRNAIIRLAAFQNPEFYKKQAIRMPTFNTPRVISCAEMFPEHIALPRGCIDAVIELLESLRINVVRTDKRFSGHPIETEFVGTLYPHQQEAAQKLLSFDEGVLSAGTAFGKTVLAAYLIAQRKVNTLILVHRNQLLEQWIVRLLQFLNIQPKDIGQIGGGKRKPTGKIDIAIIQSLSRKGVVDNIVADYGYIIIDECHHISAPSFEAIVRQFKGKYITGLSATVVRKDGHHPIIFMNCGPIRYKVCAKEQSKEKPFQNKLIVYNTDFRLPLNLDCSARVAISDLYNALIVDIKRNSKIVEDVMNNIYEGRFLMLLTERREHLDYFREIFSDRIKNLVMFKGGMNKKQIVVAMDNLKSIPENEPALILATGRYIGEGFDESRIDTLFLGLPVSWKGTIIQYAGRLNRLHRNKKEVRIYDYVDRNVQMSARMFERRLKGYRAIGYNYDGDWLPRKPAWLK